MITPSNITSALGDELFMDELMYNRRRQVHAVSITLLFQWIWKMSGIFVLNLHLDRTTVVRIRCKILDSTKKSSLQIQNQK